MTSRLRPATSLLTAAVLALAAAGCGTAEPPTTESGTFTGEEQRVAATVTDFGDAAGKQETDKICTDLLASALVERLGGDRCADELKASLRDTNSSDLTIPDRGIRITGREATARVVTELGDEDATDTVGLVQERGRWRISELGAPAS